MPQRTDPSSPTLGWANHVAAQPGPDVVETEVLVAGAGIVGLALGIALAQAGVNVTVVGRLAARMPGRTVALLQGSIRLLEGLGLWSDLAARAAPMKTMRLVDDTGSLFRIGPVSFQAAEIGKPWFGWNVENWQLVESLAAAAAETAGLQVVEQHVADFQFAPSWTAARLADGRSVRAPLIVAADGRRSPARTAAGLHVRTWSYPQTAMTAILKHERDHDGISTEFHTRNGPFTLVPLPGLPEAPHRSSLVWVTSPDQARARSALDGAGFARRVERRSHMLLGRMEVEGERGSFPISGLQCSRMAGHRIALAGESGHGFPPIGAQGLNLGLRDAASLAELLADAKHRKVDLGSPVVLDRYARARRGDVALRTAAVDMLNRALLADLLPVDFLRGSGLLALAGIGPLRRLAMRNGLMPKNSGFDLVRHA